MTDVRIIDGIKVKQSPKFPDYLVSECGRVYSLRVKSKVKLLKTRLHHGYPQVSVHQNGRLRNQYCHRMVIETWGPPQPTSKHECAHNDNNRANSHISNLRWATGAENNADKKKFGTSRHGRPFPKPKFTVEQVLFIRSQLNAKKMSHAQISQMFNVSVKTINAMYRRKSWKHVKEAA